MRGPTVGPADAPLFSSYSSRSPLDRIFHPPEVVFRELVVGAGQFENQSSASILIELVASNPADPFPCESLAHDHRGIGHS